MSHVKGRPIEILLIEDSPSDVRLMREALGESKIHNNMSVTSDGVEAMDFLRREGKYVNAPRPCIILLDLNMPRKDGREVLAEIKSDENLKAIPVVVLTTSEASEDVHGAYNLHANCYITKPIDMDKFIQVVRSVDEFWLKTARLPGGDPYATI